ncbi:hypothetical protein MM300_00660 [Evansella sp. LMS18]|uniref:hypothetical protein n=1 Tax=Evansella sp. LMS18 TaxID=2924033 RepID=UPI0020D0443D|nr:hypothetical protein [Evansella sp. LMS18]UTR10883.1 hypothetical protein MM300_00660 [Evansella sp. LMS18]
MLQSIMLNQLLGTADITRAKQIQLRPGEIFQGSAVRFYPGQLAQLKLGGLTLTAKLETPLEAGRKYWLQVQGQEGLPKLKVLENVPVIQKNGFEQGGSKHLLQQFGVISAKEGEQLLRALTHENIPFTKENLREASIILKNSPLPLEEGTKVMAQMLKSGLPVTKEAFLSIASLLSQKTMGETMLQFQAGMETGGLTARFPQLFTLLESFRKYPISDYIKPFGEKEPGVVSERPAAVLSQLLRQLGMQNEFHLRQSVEGSLPPSQQTSLKALLLQFLQQAPNHSYQLREQAEFLVNRITAFQLLSSDSQSQVSTYSVQVPFHSGSKLEDLTVQWQGKKNTRGELNEDHCRIVFYLHLKHLKETVIDVQIQSRVLSVTIYNETQKSSAVNGKLLKMLEENLAELDYRLSAVKWVNPGKFQPSGKNGVPYSADSSWAYKGVDIRV